jgi:predicted flap endonuclease-1-like 5' DNA nuclease
MTELVTANWWLFLVALAIGIAVAWWIFVASRRTKIERAPKQDVLDEGAERAKRNQALIDPAVPASEKIFDTPIEPTTVVAGGSAETAMVEPEFAPAPEANPPEAPAPAPVARDDLKRMKGVGPKLEKLLNELGVTSFAQIAAWSEADIDRIDARLGTFEGRIRRDSWIEQAKLLAAGDIAGFQGKFGSL